MPKGAELSGYSSLPTSHFQQSWSRLVSVANSMAIKEADMLVVTDEKTSKLNHAV